MAPPTQPVIQFRRPQKPLTYSDSLAAGPFGYPGPPYTVAHTSYALMHMVDWIFPESTVKGIRAHHYDATPTSPAGVIARGYRCEVCNRVFFAADIDDFRHECMDGDQ